MKPPRYEEPIFETFTLLRWALLVLSITACAALAGCPKLGASEPIKHVGPAACYPDPTKTPGCIIPQVTAEQVTTTGYTETARHVSKQLKWRVFILYGFAAVGEPLDAQRMRDLEHQFEIDHFISLELGGSNDIKNLWPQPYAAPVVEGQTLGARQKDVVETGLHRLIKQGKLSLADAQAIIRTDWVKAYFEIKTGKPVTIPK